MSSTENPLKEYEWMVVVGAFFAFFTAFGIGANDVANAFATSVGSKALRIRDAMIIAAVFEFAGSVLLGGHVSDTIRKGIASQECFVGQPAVLMWGMVSVCLCTGLWLYLATYLELPVSTTHSAVGGVIGMAMVTVGATCVDWGSTTDEPLYVTGVGSIVMSWVFSPVLSAILAALIFGITRTFVLRNDNSTERALQSYPILVWFSVSMCLMYVLIKGAKGQNKAIGFDPEGDDLGIAIGVGVGAGLLVALASIGVRGYIRGQTEMESESFDEPASKPAEASVPVTTQEEAAPTGLIGYVRRALETDVDAIVAENEETTNIHNLAEKFPRKTEVVFKYMQILTAALDAFAHGANDVANAMGPYASVYFIYKNQGSFSKKNDVGNDMYWILAIGGFGIVVGLGMYGYKIMYAIGIKVAKITPSRGFSIELGAMFVVLLGSRFGIPLSTTHCQVGATLGVAAMEGRTSSTNWTIVAKIVAGWIFTMIINGLFTATICAIGMAAIDWNEDQTLSPWWASSA